MSTLRGKRSKQKSRVHIARTETREVLLLEDDGFLAQTICEALQDLGCSCTKFPDVAAIDSRLKGASPAALIVDMRIPVNGSAIISSQEARAGFESGQAVLRNARSRWPKVRAALTTGNPSEPVRKWCLSHGIEYFIKPIARETLARFVGAREPQAFVVHGRNLAALRSTKRALKRAGVQPVVLMERSNLGRTVIEKFEEVAESCDCAIIVLSPDDIGGLASSRSSPSQLRARQNVLFELGYFCGTLGRRSGAVIVVEYGDVEIPSDIAGIIRLDGKMPLPQRVSRLQAELSHILASGVPKP